MPHRSRAKAVFLFMGGRPAGTKKDDCAKVGKLAQPPTHDTRQTNYLARIINYYIMFRAERKAEMQILDLSNVLSPEEEENFRDAVKAEAQRRPCTELLKKSKHGNYCCPACGSGTGKNGTGAVKYYSDTNKWYCHKCETGGDYLDIIGLEYGMTEYDDILLKAAELFHISKKDFAGKIRKVYPTPQKPAEAPQKAQEAPQADYMEYYMQCRERLTDPAAVSYLQARGISTETAYNNFIGYDPAADPANAPGAMGDEYRPHPCPRIIIPSSRGHYVGRRIDGGEKFQKLNSKGSTPQIFNAAILSNPKLKYLFVCEGAFDALAVMETKRNAIALNSTENADKLIKQLEEIKPNAIIILCLDNDDAGREKTEKIKADIKDLRNRQKLAISFLQADICCGYKDPNEALVKDRDKFFEAVKEAIKEAKKVKALADENATPPEWVTSDDPDEIPPEAFDNDTKPEEAPAADEIQTEEAPKVSTSVSDYLTSGIYRSDIEYFKAYKDRKTGFAEIDKYLTLYPGLAVLGGASSLGKTTFAVNLIDKLLERGETVLYFTLEQLPIEIITKSLARILKEQDPFTPLTNIDIKNGATCAQLETIEREYAARAGNYHIFTGDFRTTAADIVNKVEVFRRDHGGDSCKPIVIIDYLQLIAPPENFRGGVREYTDENIKTLKDMQKRNGLFVLMISNFNRSSNYEPVSYESFKETSMIEFTADYVWGLQLAILDAENIDFYTIKGPKGGRSDRPIDQKRKLINEAQKAIPKKVEFVSLKNRNGKQFFKAFFEYYPQHDLFVAADCDGFFKSFSANPFEEDGDEPEGNGKPITARF